MAGRTRSTALFSKGSSTCSPSSSTPVTLAWGHSTPPNLVLCDVEAFGFEPVDQRLVRPLHFHLEDLIYVGFVQRRFRGFPDDHRTYFRATGPTDGLLKHGVAEFMMREEYLAAFGGHVE